MDKLKIRENIEKKIRELRQSFGLSQEQLAEHLGVSLAFVGLIERGGRGTSLTNLIKISSLFDVSIDELIKCSSKYDNLDHNSQKIETLRVLASALPDTELDFIIATVKLLPSISKNKSTITV